MSNRSNALIIQDIDAPLPLGASRPDNESLWADYVAAHPDADFFHLPGWRRAIGGALGHDSYCRMALRITPQGLRAAGVLPMFHVKHPLSGLLFGSGLISTAFTVGGGILADDAEAADALALDAMEIGARLGVDYIELRGARIKADAATAQAEGKAQAPWAPEGWLCKDSVYAGFSKTLTEDDEARLKAIPRKKRADLRKALKSGALSIDADAPLDVFHALYSESLRNLGTPGHAKGWYGALREAFGDAVEISAVQGPDGPVAALMSFYFRDRVMPYYGGAGLTARKLHAYDYLYYALMNRAYGRGARIFDFGRSKYETGAFAYKTHWGFAPEPLSYHYHLVKARTMPDVNPNNPKYRLFVENWKRLPLGAANRLGPFFARQLG